MEKISKIEIDGVEYSVFDEETSRNLTNISNSHINNIEKQYAVGYSNTEISNNYSWIQATSPITNRSRSCCYGNGYYVVAGTSGDLAYSTDSVSWTKLTPFTSAVITGIAYGNGKFLAVDSNGLLWSCNLVPYGEWSNIYTTTIQLEGIRFINDRFFAVGDSGYLAYSIDGISWQELNSNTTNGLIDITYGQGKYVAIGLNGAMVYSLNGQEWYDNTDTSFTTSYRHIAYGKNMFVAGGQNGAMRYSYDGLVWQNGTKNSTATVGWVRGFAYTSCRFYSVIYTTGGAGEVWYSENGIDWKVVYQTSGRLWTICEGDGIFITSGENGRIYTLDLGIEWTNIKPQGAFDIYYRFILSKNNGNIVYSENYYDDTSLGMKCIETSDSEEANVVLEANKYYILNSQVAPKIILELKDYDINETTKYKEYMGEIRVDENNIDIELPNGIRWNSAEGVSINENLLTLESKKTYLFSILNYIGLISSISNPSLEPLSLTINGSLLSWNEVKNAQSYIVVNGATKEQYETTNTFIDLSTIIVGAGNHTITVIAKNNYYNDSSNNTNYIIGTELTAPTNLVYSDGNLSWDSVENAVGYKVTLFALDLSGAGNTYTKTVEVPTNLCDVINEFGDLVSGKTYTAYVVAVGDKQLYYDSPGSTSISITI